MEEQGTYQAPERRLPGDAAQSLLMADSDGTRENGLKLHGEV